MAAPGRFGCWARPRSVHMYSASPARYLKHRASLVGAPTQSRLEPQRVGRKPCSQRVSIGWRCSHSTRSTPRGLGCLAALLRRPVHAPGRVDMPVPARLHLLASLQQAGLCYLLKGISG